MNILQAIEKGKYILKKKRIKSYNLDSEILMSQVFQKKRIDIVMNPNTNLSDTEIDTLVSWLGQMKMKTKLYQN